MVTLSPDPTSHWAVECSKMVSSSNKAFLVVVEETGAGEWGRRAPVKRYKRKM